MPSGATISYTAATKIANTTLDWYMKGDALVQSMQDKPLIRALEKTKKTFAAGKEFIRRNVQGTFMSDTAGFFAGYTGTDAMPFAQSDYVEQCYYAWYETAAGLVITFTDLKKDGIVVEDNNKTSSTSRADIARITALFENYMSDYRESWLRSMNLMHWKDGSQDAKAVPGVLSLITDDPTNGTTGGLTRGTGVPGTTNWWWYNRARVGGLAPVAGLSTSASPTGPKIVPSASAQTLSKVMRSEARQLRRFGGRPTVLLAGSAFLEALELEVEAKGTYTQSGFAGGNTDIGMAPVALRGVGVFEYDPTLDDLGLSKRCYIIDPRHLMQMPMEGQDGKTLNPTRPYDIAVFLQAKTYTGALVADQLNCHGVYEIA